MSFIWGLIIGGGSGFIAGTWTYYHWSKIITKRLRRRNDFLEKNPQIIVSDPAHIEADIRGFVRLPIEKIKKWTKGGTNAH